MVEFMYSMLLVGTAGGVGLASVVSWLNWKMYRLDKSRARKSFGLLLLGIMAQNGILAEELIRAGTSEVSFEAVAYALSLAISTIGLGWRAGQLTSSLALYEAVQGSHDENGGAWLKNVERRLTAEEARNTDIEEVAREMRIRADVAEKRADAAEEREDQ